MKNNYDIEAVENGYPIMLKIGQVIESSKTPHQLVTANLWFKELCKRHLWLHHHKPKFDFMVMVKITNFRRKELNE